MIRAFLFLAVALTLCLIWDASAAPWIEIGLSGTAAAFLLAFIVGPGLLCAGGGLATSMLRPFGEVKALFAIVVCVFLPWTACFSISALDCLLSTDCV